MPEPLARNLRPRTDIEPADQGDNLGVDQQVEGVEYADPDALARARAAMREDEDAGESWAMGDEEDDEVMSIGEQGVLPEEKEAPGYAKYFQRAWNYAKALFSRKAETVKATSAVEAKPVVNYDAELGFQAVGDGKDERRRLLHYIDALCSDDRGRSSTAMRALVGKTVEFHEQRYTIAGKVGEGGFGTVVKVKDEKTGTIRALKVAHSFDIAALAGGEDEQAVNTARKHVLDIASLYKLTRKGKNPEQLQRTDYSKPAFPILHDAVLVPNPDAKNQRTFFEVMELIPGRTFLKYAEELNDSETDQQRVLEISRRLIEIVRSLHTQGVLHMDIKPKNIMVTPTDDPILLDFGLVHQPELAQRQIEKQQKPFAVSTGRTTELHGDPLYAQQGEPLTPQRDVYGLGKTLNNLLTHYIRNNFSRPGDNHLYTPERLQPLVDVVEAMSQFNPKDRITLEQALARLEQVTTTLENVV